MAIAPGRAPLAALQGEDRDRCHRLRCPAAIQRVYPHQQASYCANMRPSVE